MPTDSIPTVGLTTTGVAKRYRVSEDKVRLWINRGELSAINTASALCGRPRWIVLPDALGAFERRRTGGPAPKTARRKRKAAGVIDYYPDAAPPARPAAADSQERKGVAK